MATAEGYRLTVRGALRMQVIAPERRRHPVDDLVHQGIKTLSLIHI